MVPAMADGAAKPLIVQSDHTILVEVDSPGYAEARDALLGFAELVKSPEHVHTYRVTPLSIWNARAAGHDAESMVEVLERYARYPPPANVLHEVREFAQRYGRLRLVRDDNRAGGESDMDGDGSGGAGGCGWNATTRPWRSSSPRGGRPGRCSPTGSTAEGSGSGRRIAGGSSRRW